MCNDCDDKHKRSYDDWMDTHLPTDSTTTREVTYSDLAIDAIMSSRLELFSSNEVQSIFNVSDVEADRISTTANMFLSKVEHYLLSHIQK